MLSKLKDLYGRIFINQAKTPLPIPEARRKHLSIAKGITPLEPEDVGWVMSEIINESGHGHFDKQFLQPMTHDELRAKLFSTIDKGYFDSDGKRSHGAIYGKYVKGKIVGFMWIKQANQLEYEIVMMGVDREYRRRGIATEFMQMMLEKVIPATGQSRAQASLYMTSQHMMKLLRTAGFKKAKKQPEKQRVLLERFV
ncbi:GNAT family N-acetyltransferase [Vibrio astriarenae]|uniref:GNAT family N-acetyltransferase n=1 Tax=Vibrio astriarenae TaxID=1481923 RepID=A0A7Z2T2R2_9VIBR|nr:GNAT family N-acetyltransferase [Vibrio astriarenae]QIA63206.1 GNAT family N-acetyltransferase [Vibrio astriarenae]